MELPDVQVGQVYRDLDIRMAGRRVVVERVSFPYAHCRNVLGGRPIRILLRRMRPVHNGFRLVGRKCLACGTLKEGDE